jgi:hypothetical protein
MAAMAGAIRAGRGNGPGITGVSAGRGLTMNVKAGAEVPRLFL